MKKNLISLFLITIFSGLSFAQTIYLRAGGGFGLPIATSTIGEEYLRTEVYNGTTTVNSYSTKGVTGSYGAGANFNFALGYKFNENLIFELSTQYLMSNKYKTGNNDIYYYKGTGAPYTTVDNTNTKTSATALFLNPSFIFSAGFGKVAPYGRFGFVFGSPKVSGERNYYYSMDGVDSSQTKWEYSKRMAFGFQGAIGMNWKINEKLDVYTELNYVSMSYYAGEYNLTKSVYNSFNRLPGTALIDKQTIYKKTFDPNAVNNVSTQPRVALRQATPFSAISLQVGIRYAIFKFTK
jgi:hypothetical protein